MDNQLLSFLNEEEQKELSEEELLEVDVEVNDETDSNISSRKLHTSKQDKAITDLHRMIKDHEIILSPNFQRRYVWTNKGASKFIESLLINIPIPTIFVSANEDGIWDVVDGQQRLTAITKFLDNELTLSGLETLSELNKSKYEDLDEKTKRLINNRTLSVVIIDNDSSEDIKFDIFMRINQGSAKLNEQELRNCIYRGPFMNAIKKLGENEKLLKILETKETFITRYQHLEIIERFFSIREVMDSSTFYLKDGAYGGRITNSINSFLKMHQNISNDEISHYMDLFEQSIGKVYEVFGNNAFRQYFNHAYNYNINRSVAEIQLVILSFISDENIQKYKNEIRESFEMLMMKDLEFQEAFSHATNNTNVVNYRYHVWGSALKNIIALNE